MDLLIVQLIVILAVLGNNSNIFSEYNSQTGVRSQGVFPYDGVNLTIRLNKINFDNYENGHIHMIILDICPQIHCTKTTKLM